MYSWSWRSTLGTLFITGYTLLGACSAEGSSVFDWLFSPCSSESPEVVTYSPAAVAAAPVFPPQPSLGSGTTAFSPGVAGSFCGQPGTGQSVTSARFAPNAACAPVTVYSPPAVARRPGFLQGLRDRLGCESPPRPRIGTARQTQYRTTWKRVPVTQYRPEVSTDPITGQRVTVMKPCTTQAWQPVRRRCGFFERLFGLCDPAPAAATTVCAPAVTMSESVVPAPPFGTSQPGGSVPVPGTPAPYYVPDSAPFTSPPASDTPTLTPGGSPSEGSGQSPADRRPSLEPGEVPSGGSSARPSSSSANRGASVRSNRPGTTTLKSDGRATRQSRLSPTPPRPSRRTVPLPTEQRLEKQPEKQRDGGDRRKPTPVPDPDAVPAPEKDKSTAPELLNPGDRVATRDNPAPRWDHAPISWAQEQSVPNRPVTAPRQQSRREPLDDGGWHSIAP